MRKSGFSGVVARLTGVNGIAILAAAVAGPITARVLGVAGRGDLAAITAVLTVGPWLLDLGLSLWVGRERARGVTREQLLGAAAPVALACSLIAVVGAIPLAHALGRGRPVVTDFLELVLFLMPLSVQLLMISGIAVGESRWGLIVANGILGSVLPAAAVVVLLLAGELTVASAAACYVGGTLLASLLYLSVLRGMGRPVTERWRIAAATRYGIRSWFSTIAATGNVRLDQVLMVALVSSRELGLYVVAVTISSLLNGLVTAVASAQYPRVAGGDAGIVARSLRITVAVVTVAGLCLALASVWLIPFVFGAGFRAAVPMAVILLIASVPMAGAFVLSAALNAANDPGATMRAELAALAFTVPALIIFLPRYGGVLAAIVSLVAYTIRMGMELGPARRAFSTTSKELLVPSRDDWRWACAWVRRARSASRQGLRSR